jgi:oligopeptide/dipeptide ABC transporter ATP-binding protein
MTVDSNGTLLEVRDLRVHFPIRRGWLIRRIVGKVRAVDGVDLDVPRGQTVGLVGESGCGKSTTGKAIVRLLKPTTGSITYDGKDLARLGARAMRPYRRQIQMIFQDPYASLDARMTIQDIIGEPLLVHRLATGAALRARVRELLALVGLDPNLGYRYPHEFSGGQRQRIGIARALALAPDLVICDEPVSALDVSVQAQVITLLERLQAELKLTYLFIAHDLAIVRHVSHRVAVMYLGRVVEEADNESLYADPQHPYTQALLASVPRPEPRSVARPGVRGEVANPAAPPPGCPFHPRCPRAQAICHEQMPPLEPVRTGHRVACHFPGPAGS